MFAQQGAILHIIELNATAADEVVKEINDTGVKAFAHSCNVANQNEVVAAFDKIGSINIFANNAGIAHMGKAGTIEKVDFDWVINVNVKGVYNCLYAAIPQLQKDGETELS